MICPECGNPMTFRPGGDEPCGIINGNIANRFWPDEWFCSFCGHSEEPVEAEPEEIIQEEIPF